MNSTIQFYFDFLSPFAYWGFLKTKELRAQGMRVELQPVVMANLFNHWGIKGPAEIAPKREFILRSLLRRAVRENVAFQTPKTHPFNPLYALRLATSACSAREPHPEESQWKVVETLWHWGWVQGNDLGDPESLACALNESGLKGEEWLERTFQPEVRAMLKRNTTEAIQRGVFGVPTFIHEDEIFWGIDSAPDLIAKLEGRDTLNRDRYEHVLRSTPRAASQRIPSFSEPPTASV